MVSFFVGPEYERWSPQSWDDLKMAATAGLLNETDWVELKKDVPASSPESNLELARDLASLAIEGGVLVIGVVDRQGKAGDIVGVENVEALADRVEKVARSTVHPPLSLRPVRLVDPADEQHRRGCLLVAVPSSPDAPHMVDGHYWGRSSAGKVVLPDGQVRRLLDERQVDAQRAEGRLRAWMESPPLNSTDDGRLYFVAAPQFVRPDRMTALLYQGDSALANMIQQAADACERSGHYLSIASATNYRRGGRSEGYTTADRLGGDPVQEGSLIRVEVRDDGEVDCLFGRSTARDGTDRLMSFAETLEHVDQALKLTQLLGDRIAYQGSWDIRVTITETAGAHESSLVLGGAVGAMWEADTYDAAMKSTQARLEHDSGAVLRELLVPLARALRVERHHRGRIGAG